MKTTALISLFALALVSACSDKPADTSAGTTTAGQAPAPAGTSWKETVVTTPDGGFLMGNPNAAVKLVEYGSLTCSHCADFAETGVPKLIDSYVSTGQVSFEFRNYVRDPIDVTAALTTRCGGTGPFFQMTEQLFADQKNWFAKAQSLSPADQAALSKMQPAEQFSALSAKLGFDAFAQERGVSADKLKACYADKASIDTLVAVVEKANKEIQLTGTPTFLINGNKVADVAAWADLEPKIRAALGS